MGKIYGENLWGNFTGKICGENLRGKFMGKMPCLINQENRLKYESPAFDQLQLQFLWKAFQISFGQEK